MKDQQAIAVLSNGVGIREGGGPADLTPNPGQKQEPEEARASIPMGGTPPYTRTVRSLGKVGASMYMARNLTFVADNSRYRFFADGISNGIARGPGWLEGRSIESDGLQNYSDLRVQRYGQRPIRKNILEKKTDGRILFRILGKRENRPNPARMRARPASGD